MHLSLRSTQHRAGPPAGEGAVRHQVKGTAQATTADGDRHRLTAPQGVAALSLDALSSVAYGPEAVVVALVPAGLSALRLTVPIAIAITALLVVLVLSYRQVIVVHPDGGGAYAVAKKSLGRRVSLLAAASLVVDYVLTVAVSLAAGAASLASVFPSVAPHLLALCLGGLILLAAVNLLGIAESARFLIFPTLVFVVSIFAVLIVGPFHSHPVATIGTSLGSFKPVEGLGIVLVLIAQLTAGAFGTGWPFYVSNIAVTLILALAANTSFGGLPVLMSLLAKDNRLPHVFGLRAERPVYRYGVVALALLAGLLLVALGADTSKLLPLFAIGVFIGFTVSQTGLVLHWAHERPQRWWATAALNGFGAMLSAAAAVIFLASKFTEGAWLLLIIIPSLMLLFTRVEEYYDEVGLELGLGHLPARPSPREGLIVVPIATITAATAQALAAACSYGDTVVAVAADTGNESIESLQRQWRSWDPGMELIVLPSPTKGLVAPLVSFVKEHMDDGKLVTVLIVELEPRRRRYEILHNQRGAILAAALRARTDAVVATLPYRLKAGSGRH